MLLQLCTTLLCYSTLFEQKILRVIDGDTMQISAPYLEHVGLKGSLYLRIEGIDTPESGWRAHCEKEEQLALQATTYANHSLFSAVDHHIKFVGWDKYGGRVLGNVWYTSFNSTECVDYAKDVITRGFARPYNGNKKPDWCT